MISGPGTSFESQWARVDLLLVKGEDCKGYVLQVCIMNSIRQTDVLTYKATGNRACLVWVDDLRDDMLQANGDGPGSNFTVNGQQRNGPPVF